MDVSLSRIVLSVSRGIYPAIISSMSSLNKVFNFEQSIALEKKLSIKEMLLLDYIYKLFDPEDITNKAKNDKLYCRLTYSKMLNDLPILQVKERQLRNIIISLEKKTEKIAPQTFCLRRYGAGDVT